MAQYKHDRFFKFYIQSLYKTKGTTKQNIQVRNDEDLEIDLMFIADPNTSGWQQERLGLFDTLMQVHPTIVVEHYSSYLEETDLLKSITRKNLYWEPKSKELMEITKAEAGLTSSQQISKDRKQAVKQQIQNQNPFTWILTVHCSDKLLRACEAKADLALGVGVYQLPPMFRMGIVVIDRLPDGDGAMWLKMLGEREAARKAFAEIEQLSPERREKNDIIKACIKYCVYLRDLPTDRLTTEEREFMKTMAQIDAWYEAEINNAELKGKLEGKLEGKVDSASTIVRAKFGVEVLTPQLVSRLQQLNDRQLDEFMVGMFSWQESIDMERWLAQTLGVN
jgi:hypothetical protein